ncbi:clustered mitochondria protein homolog [Salarias fasciatus]|uniref:clustered mitochondria protein homolog n=1 Tax=Salarias fasciatus TaxID=181472 RepID=UPI001176AF81|nr:clustered mitochondria protein homolog [Salarias fasciatus]
MGNVLQCCHALLSFFRRPDGQREVERSPLLSSEESACASPTLPDDFEDDLLTVSTGATNLALEPEHFLFPDIILSSNLGGDVTLVEPMVCLLVSEEEEAVGVSGQADGGRDGRDRGYSEVQTQTEAETQMGTGVQTQTETQAEVQTQTESSSDAVQRQVCTLNTGTAAEAEVDEWSAHEILRQLDVLLEAQTSHETHTEISHEEEEITVAAQLTETLQPEQTTEPVEQLRTCDTLQQSADSAQEKTDFTWTEDLTSETRESEKSPESELREAENTSEVPETVEKFDPDGFDSDLRRHDEHVDEASPLSDPDTAVTNTHRPADEPQNSHLHPVEEPETCEQQPEDGDASGMKQMTLFLVDRLFLAAPHAKAPPSQPEEKRDGVLPEQSEDESEQQLDLRDIVELQETGFAVRIQPPGAESFQLQVSGQMLVLELHQVLMDHEITCHRTCFSLQLGGATLDNLMELRSNRDIQEGALIRVVEDSYTMRDARLHVRHVRNLLRSLDPADAYNGVNCSSLSYLSVFTSRYEDSESTRRRASEREPVDCSPPEYVLPGCRERPLSPLQPVRDDWKPLQCLRVLTTSSWNPPPGNRKMHGDLLYLHVLTIEDRELNITSSTRGFYLNQSTAFSFNPKPAVPKILCHSLVELLNQVSPAFKKNFSALQKKRVQQHPYERIAAPFQVFTWTAPHGDHTLDRVRAEETHTSRTGQDEHTAGQSRDWNEELQQCRELPRASLQERLHRERSIFKTNSDFVAAATRGAVAVVDGNVMPLNPGESPHMQMFMWNNIFFSLGFDVSEHYRPLGGNTAAHAAARCDLRGAQAYAAVDPDGLHTLGTAVVDYRGVRVIAQTIVPGILEKNQEQSVVYGSNDNGKTVLTHPRFLELLDKANRSLRIQRHQVLDHHGRPVELCSGMETIGILGNDGRPYILDLLRTFPRDLNFQFTEDQVTEEAPQECRSSGFPRPHRHSLASLRPELIQAFVQHRHEVFVQMVSQEELGQPKGEDKASELRDELAGDRAPESARRNATLRACKAVGSVSDSHFDIRFNPDVCCPGARFPPESLEEVRRQRRLLWDAAAFLLSSQIPALLRDCLDHTALPMDGATLTSALHQRGVNVRYLGAVLTQLDRMEERARLSHVQRIAVSELITRSAKHVFRTYLQDVEPAAFSAAVSHFLNCLLSSSSCFPDSCPDELLSRRRSRRRRSHGGRAASLTDGAWSRLTPAELWVRIRAEAQGYYHYTLGSDGIDHVIEKYNLQKISLLREMTIKTGIQVQLREYAFESRHRPVFGEEDVVNMFPVVSHLRPTATDAARLVGRAQAAVQQGLLKHGYELLGQAVTLFSSVCGVLHEDVCMCLRLLGRLSYILGDNADAVSHQEKTVMSSERVHGIDHPQTIQDYTYLALYYFAGGRHATALQLLYRARYLTLLVCGDDHPQVALLDSMLGLVLYGLLECELALKFLLNALKLTSKYHGGTSLKQAHSHHVLATVYETKGEFRLALQHEKEAYAIYKSQVGEKHSNTAESSEYLKRLTEQAVTLQKALRHIYSNTPGACISPPKFSTPSLHSILQQLNLTCGIILISLSPKEIADLRTELKEKEKAQVEELENQLLKQEDLKTADSRQ